MTGRKETVAWTVLCPLPVTIALGLQTLLSDGTSAGLSETTRYLFAGLSFSVTPAALIALKALRSGRPFSVVASVFLSYVFAVICVIAFLRGGVLSSTLPWLLVISTGAMLAAGHRFGLASSAISVGIIAGFWVLDTLEVTSRLEILPAQSQLRWLIDLTAVCTLLLVEVAIFERNKQRAFEVLRNANGELRTARDEADAANQSKSALLANVSHEIRSPMTSILGFTDLVRERSSFADSHPEATRDLDTVKRNGLHLLAIINDILDISKIESGRFELDWAPFSPAQIAEDVVSLMRVRSDSKGIGLSATVDESLPPRVLGDAKRIKQVLLNLVGNAIKFTSEGSVRLHVLPAPGGPAGALSIEVTDDGIGMSQEQIESLFLPFSQADASTTRLYGGTGLGLAICKRLVELMGGQIHVASDTGVGSIFRVEVPTRVAAEQAHRSKPKAEASDRVSFDELEGRVLVVDDLEDNRTLLSRVLVGPRLEVELVDSGERACARVADASKPAPDVILMDLQMGRMDGFEATARIRRGGFRGPILALTAHALVSEQDRCLESGFDDYLTKPIDRSALIDAFRRYLGPDSPRPVLRSSDATERWEGLSDESGRPEADATATAPEGPGIMERWVRLREFFVPESAREDPAELSRARFITTFSLIPLPLIPLWAALFPWIYDRTTGLLLSALMMLVAPLLLAIPLRARLGRSIRAPLHILLSYTYVMFGFMTSITSGLGSAAAYWIIVLPMLAVAIVGVLPGIIWGALCVAQWTAFLVLTHKGILFPDVLPAHNVAFTAAGSLTSIICLVGGFAYLYERASADALRAFRHAHDDLARARDQADRANRAKSDFVANISHELRTPMTAILGFTDVLLERWPRNDEEHAHVEALHTVRRNGQHLLEIINDILDLSKIEAGKIEIHAEELDPRATAREILDLMRVRAEQKNLELQLELDTPVPETIHGDTLRLRQILLNLLGNALKFTEEGSVSLRLALRLEPSGGRLCFAVHDTGIGIAPEQLGALFSPFQQADASISRIYGGTGLGLTICKRLSELMGGRIQACSSPGEGSTFVLELPTGSLEGVRLCDNLEPRPERTPEVSDERGPSIDARVLLVDDSPDNQRLISLLLRKAGAHIEVAPNGRVALDQALDALRKGEPFDIVLMDLQMPVLDGYSAIRLLRQGGYTGPIVALSAHAMAEARERSLAAGATGYATKPVQRARLLSMIHDLVQDSPTQRGNA